MYARNIPSEPNGMRKSGNTSFTRPKAAYTMVWNSARRFAMKMLSVRVFRLTAAINATNIAFVHKCAVKNPKLPLNECAITKYTAAATIAEPPAVIRAALMSLAGFSDRGKNLTSPELRPIKLKLEIKRVIEIRADDNPMADGEYKCAIKNQKPKPSTDIMAVLDIKKTAFLNRLS